MTLTVSVNTIWELFFKELPQARDWVVLDRAGTPLTYGKDANYRYYWDRCQPEAQAFWDEGAHPGYVKGRLTTRIRTFKGARSLQF